MYFSVVFYLVSQNVVHFYFHDKFVKTGPTFILFTVKFKASKQASLFAKNNKMTILQNINNTMAGYQKEILPSSWSPIVK